MELCVLNTEREAVSIVDVYESMIWTDRFYKCGDFELYTTMNSEIRNKLKKNYYLTNSDSEHAMIVEDFVIKSDAEDGNYITITGESLEAILKRRIVWGLRVITGNFQNGIETLLNENVISPSDSKRKIDNFIFKKSDDTQITSLTIDTQFTGDNLYEAIQSMCEEKGVGFKITFDENKNFVFELYAGIDRSYEQTEVPYVVFSPNFENLINSNYTESNSTLKNVTLIGGEGEGSERRYASTGDTSVSGLDRRELFTDARDISSDVDGETISDSEYTALLVQRGKEKLAENTQTMAFEGETETTLMYRYGEHFYNGDIVQIEDSYGNSAKVRVVEIVMSDDTNSTSIYPTFTTL